MRYHLIFVILPVMALVFAGQAFARQVTDQIGRSVTVPDRLQRVVALTPALTEIVYDLGREDLLVATTQFSDFPEGAKNLPRIGSYIQPDLEKLVALRPDLCLATKDGNPKDVVEKIMELGIPVFVVNPRDLAGVMATVTGLGEVLQAQDKAKAIVADMQRRLETVTGIIAKAKTRPGVFFQIDAAPMVSAGDQTFIDELIRLAGGRNLAAGPASYPRFNWEELLRLRPEVVIITSMAGGQSVAELQASWRRWPDLPAVKNNLVAVVDANLFDRPTPRLIDGLEVLTAILHPELFHVP